jgi:hypothetical protein
MHRLAVIEKALLQTEHFEFEDNIVAFARCVCPDIFGIRFSYFTRLLVIKACELHTLRGLSGWKKVFLKDEHKDQVKTIIDQIDEETKNFSVRNSNSITHSSSRQQVFRLPFRWPSNEIRRLLSSVLS